MNPIDHAKQLLLMASKDMKALDLMIMPESVDELLSVWVCGEKTGFMDLRAIELQTAEKKQ
ncbi:hypothetical protein [Geobacter sp.]|uniref:hypothetical protein n=1 Tax=Geobacter sp. TaxID=46610 RepID=UPI00261261AC|nr:hypothetical protein [Geobacter sp.]